MTAADFKPEFDPTPGVTGPIQGGLPTFTPINPLYCATPQCAADLVAVLSDLKPAIEFRGPLGTWPGGPFAQTKKVPWLIFQGDNGPVPINAGVLASIFTHGYPPTLAELMLRQSIAQTIQDGQAG